MKNSTKFILGLLLAIMLLGLYPIYMFNSNFNAVEKNAVRGNGELKKEMRSLANFEELDVSGDYDIILKQGDFKVEIEAESNLLEYLTTDVRGGALRLNTKEGNSLRFEKTPKVYVTMPDLKRIGFYGSGSVTNDSVFTAEIVEVQILGHGEMDLNFECSTMKTSINGAGEIRLKGKTDFFESSHAGDGTVKAENFVAENTNIRISGSGEVRTHTNGHLEISISGDGTVLYTGNPENINQQINGVGDVRRI